MKPETKQSMLTFSDAVAIALGCTDYSGGYRYEPDLHEAYKAGVQTVINALENAQENGLSCHQSRALHGIGSQMRDCSGN